jgi:integrase
LPLTGSEPGQETGLLGTVIDWNTREECEQANRRLLNLYNKPVTHVPTVAELVQQYRVTDMPERASSRRGYESYFRNHILPKWGSLKIDELKPDPLEQWIRGLKLSMKTKRNIRGLLSVLWDFAAKKEYVSLETRNPVSLVRLRKQPGEVRRLPLKDLSTNQFRLLLDALDPMLQTLFTVQLSLGLRISEVFGLKWKDIDWLHKTVSIERGVVKQIVDAVKTETSRHSMPVPDALTGWIHTANSKINGYQNPPNPMPGGFVISP